MCFNVTPDNKKLHMNRWKGVVKLSFLVFCGLGTFP